VDNEKKEAQAAQAAQMLQQAAKKTIRAEYNHTHLNTHEPRDFKQEPHSVLL